MKHNNDHINKVLASPKLVAKDTSVANSSCRIYYGADAVSVPFVWESQPGTPKHPLSETSLPPLTPPPNYHTTPKHYSSSTMQRSNAMAKAILDYIIPKAMKSRKNNNVVRTMSPNYPPSASWSSSSSSPFWSLNSGTEKRYVSISRVPFGYDDNDEDEDDEVRKSTSSPISTMYNGIRRRGSEYMRRCNSMRKIKFAFMSIASHDNSRHDMSST